MDKHFVLCIRSEPFLDIFLSFPHNLCYGSLVHFTYIMDRHGMVSSPALSDVSWWEHSFLDCREYGDRSAWISDGGSWDNYNKPDYNTSL